MDLIQSFRRLGQMLDNSWGVSIDNSDHQLKLIRKLYKRHGLEIIKTCSACPEQYEVLKNGKITAYYRLRHGEFRVDFPSVNGETIYYSGTYGDGIFNENERLIELTKAMRKVLKHIAEA